MSNSRRSVTVNLRNNTDIDLCLVKQECTEGHWRIDPPKIVGAFSDVAFKIESDPNSFSGTIATVVYTPKTSTEAGTATLLFELNNPFVGIQRYSYKCSSKFNVEVETINGNNAKVMYVVNPAGVSGLKEPRNTSELEAAISSVKTKIQEATKIHDALVLMKKTYEKTGDSPNVANLLPQITENEREIKNLQQQLSRYQTKLEDMRQRAELLKSHTAKPHANPYSSTAMTNASSSLSSDTSSIVVRVDFDYTKSEPNELTIRAGDLITVIDNEDEIWWFGDLNGELGYFPANYVTVLNNNGKQDGDRNSKRADTSKTTVLGADSNATNESSTTRDLLSPKNVSATTAASTPSADAKAHNDKSDKSQRPLELSSPTPSKVKHRDSESREKRKSYHLDERNFKEAKDKETPRNATPQHNHNHHRHHRHKQQQKAQQQSEQPPSARPKSRTGSETSTTPNDASVSTSSATPASPRRRRRVVALFDYESVGPSELSLRRGDVVTVLDDDPNEEWWEGECDGIFGFFPKSYVVPYPPAATSTRAARALFDYKAESDNEISLAAGEVIAILDDDPKEEWWEGERFDGTRGYFPKTYVACLTSDDNSAAMSTAFVPPPPPPPPPLSSSRVSHRSSSSEKSHLGESTLASTPDKTKESNDKDKKAVDTRREGSKATEHMHSTRSSIKERVYNYFTLRAFGRKRSEKDLPANTLPMSSSSSHPLGDISDATAFSKSKSTKVKTRKLDFEAHVLELDEQLKMRDTQLKELQAKYDELTAKHKETLSKLAQTEKALRKLRTMYTELQEATCRDRVVFEAKLKEEQTKVRQLEARVQELSRGPIANSGASSAERDVSCQNNSESLERVVEELRRTNRDLERQLTEWRTRTDVTQKRVRPSHPPKPPPKQRPPPPPRPHHTHSSSSSVNNTTAAGSSQSNLSTTSLGTSTQPPSSLPSVSSLDVKTPTTASISIASSTSTSTSTSTSPSTSTSTSTTNNTDSSTNEQNSGSSSRRKKFNRQLSQAFVEAKRFFEGFRGKEKTTAADNKEQNDIKTKRLSQEIK